MSPRRTTYVVYISQLIRFARATSNLSDFNCRNKVLTAKLLRQYYRSLNFVSRFWWRFTAAKFTIRNFYNPFSQKCKHNNFLKISSILTLMSLNSDRIYKTKKTSNVWRNNTLMMLSAISADEYKQNKQTVELDSASRTFWSREFEIWCKRFSESLRNQRKV